MTIIYDSHLLDRLQARQIAENWPREIIERAEAYYRDTATGNYVAVKRMRFKEKERDMAVTYAHVGSAIKAITVHPLQEGQKESRVRSGRWKELEPKGPSAL
jgi:hypothetical protein